MLKTLKSIDPMSAARVAALMGVVWGLLVGVLLLLGMSVAEYMGRFFMGYQMILPTTSFVGAAALITLPIAYGVTGFVATYIVALVYNFVAKKFGGIKVDLK